MRLSLCFAHFELARIGFKCHFDSEPSRLPALLALWCRRLTHLLQSTAGRAPVRDVRHHSDFNGFRAWPGLWFALAMARAVRAVISELITT